MRGSLRVLALAAAILAASPTLARADPVTIPGSPLRVTLYDNGGINVQYAGSRWREFSTNAPALAGPDFFPFAAASPFGVHFNVVDLSVAPHRTGSGTEDDPYVATVQTVPRFVSGFLVRETVTYVNGDEELLFSTTLVNTSAESRTIRVAYLGAPVHGTSQDGFGVTGVEDGLRYVAGINDEQGSVVAMFEVAGSPWNTFNEATLSDLVTKRITAHMWDLAGLFDDSVNEAMHDDALAVDFGDGVDEPLPAGGSATYDVVWSFGGFDALALTAPSGSRPVLSPVWVSLKARNHGDGLPARTVRYAITGANPASGTVTTDAVGAAVIAWTGLRPGTDRLHAFLDANGDGIEQDDEAADEVTVVFDAPPAQPPPPVATPPATKPPSVSNAVTLLSTKPDARTGGATLRFRLGGPGVLRGVLTAKVRTSTLTFTRFARTVSAAGTLTIKLKPGPAAMRQLRRRGKLGVSLKATFTPRSGQPRTVTRAFTLRLARR